MADRTIDGTSRSIENVVGGSTIGSTAVAGTPVTVTGYPAGTGGSTTCAATTSTTPSGGVAYPTFTCGAFPDGTSGSPWLTHSDGRTSIVGLIGGPHQGGCTDTTSYSSPIDTTLTNLVQRSATASSDTLPKPASPNC